MSSIAPTGRSLYNYTMQDSIHIQKLGLADYVSTFERMREWTLARTDETPDELWILEHPPVFTQGQAGKPEHLLRRGNIPVVQTDRGGQITYHGPGQLVVYFLMDLKRKNIGVHDLVCRIEKTVQKLLTQYGIESHLIKGAPGIYVDNRKICSLGLRVKKGCTYHGMSLNVDMDLKPFNDINPCGYSELKMTQLGELGGPTQVTTVATDFIALFCQDKKLRISDCGTRSND